MTTLTERYLHATLRGIPESQRADVERELRSAIDDAIEDRATAGEDRESAERAVLQGLGEPSRLAAQYTGRPTYLIGPELFPVWRHILTLLLPITVPIVLVVISILKLVDGAGFIDALLAGAGTAISVGIGLAFWVTAVFAFLERAEMARDARTEIMDATGRWTVDMLPEPRRDRISAGETVGEVVTTVITLVGILVLRDAGIIDPDLPFGWMATIIVSLVALAALRVMIHLAGRWTIGMALGNAVLSLAFAVPLVWLALSGDLVNPAFAERIGWPDLADGDGPVMLWLAIAVTLVSCWEIVDGFRGARHAAPAPTTDATPTQTIG